MSVTDPPVRAKCARCVAGLCGHDLCKPGGRYEIAVTAVAGTPCCAECASTLFPLWHASLHEHVIKPGSLHIDTGTA